MKPIFNPNTCQIKKAEILEHVKQHRIAIDNLQECLTRHPDVDILTFHKKWNQLERQHKRLIARITLNESKKKSN